MRQQLSQSLMQCSEEALHDERKGEESGLLLSSRPLSIYTVLCFCYENSARCPMTPHVCPKQGGHAMPAWRLQSAALHRLSHLPCGWFTDRSLPADYWPCLLAAPTRSRGEAAAPAD